MKIAIVHSGNAGFFPRFYKSLRDAIISHGDETFLLAPNSGRNKRNRLPDQIVFGSRLNWWIHSRLFFLLGIQDVFSFWDTLDFLRKIHRHKPDLIHLHLINDKFINIPLFVQYVNHYKIPVVWTMHDCRAFTGGCPYFDEVGCDRWRTGCGNCPQKETWIDRTKWQWSFRNKWHNKIKDLTIVTPSQWLADFVSQSMMKSHPCKVIYNGVDTDRFSTPSSFHIYSSYDINKEKRIVLGCAINWEKRKGMVFFEQLASILPSNYQIVLVGGIADVDKKRLTKKGIIVVGRTKTFDEMKAWYQNALVFVNPTLADNFPTTNIEALASGTPVVTFITGGSPECLSQNCGLAVEKGNFENLYNAIIKVAEDRSIYSSATCIARSIAFSNRQYDEYVKLYHSIVCHE